MTAVTVLTLGRDELQDMLDKAATLAVERAAAKSGELMSKAELAAHYGVSTRTIERHFHQYPKPCAIGRWRRADVLRWDRDRALAPAGN